MAETAVPDRREPMLDLNMLRAADTGLRTRTIADYICKELESFLDVPPAHRVSVVRPLRTQGVGSITALKLRRTLELALLVEVEATDLLRDDSVQEVAALLAAKLDGSPGAPRPDERPAGSGVRRP